MSISLKSTGIAQSNDLQPNDPKLPGGEGRKAVATSWIGCHGLATSLEDRRTRSGWQDVVEEMAGLGADMSDDKIKTAVARALSPSGCVENVRHQGTGYAMIDEQG